MIRDVLSAINNQIDFIHSQRTSLNVSLVNSKEIANFEKIIMSNEDLLNVLSCRNIMNKIIQKRKDNLQSHIHRKDETFIEI
jgi:hypothetical protein